MASSSKLGKLANYSLAVMLVSISPNSHHYFFKVYCDHHHQFNSLLQQQQQQQQQPPEPQLTPEESILQFLMSDLEKQNFRWRTSSIRPKVYETILCKFFFFCKHSHFIFRFFSIKNFFT